MIPHEKPLLKGIENYTRGELGGSGAPEPQDSTEYDFVVLGAGVAGMTAALVGAVLGMRVLLIEKSDQVGGTTAYSSGTVWIPDNPQMRRLGMAGDAAQALDYLDALIDSRADRSLRETFVARGPEMISFLESRTDVKFGAYPHHPDYHQELPGAALGGRPLEPLPFDGRQLGRHFNDLRWPIPELTLPGGMMVTRGEAARLLRGLGSWDAIRLGATLLSRLASDRLRYPRGTRLVLGNALAARLYKGLLDHDVSIRLNADVVSLIETDGAVYGIRLAQGDSETSILSRCGVVLAGGGFPADAEWRERYLPKPTAQYTPAWAGCVGDTIRLGQAVGAAIGPPARDNALWFPSSVTQRKDGSTAVYPHIVLDRAKPGLIAVNAAGKRFTNEAVSYHRFTRAMYASNQQVRTIPAALICDRAFLWKYGLGMIRPLTVALKRYLRNGYLHVDNTLAGLAARIDVDADALVSTVQRHNEFARTGVDADFGKGESIYDRNNGDAEHQPNPCLGPINTPPYYAVLVYPTPLGTSLGLTTDANANVLNEAGLAIHGLYACGCDMNSIFGGEYPGAGAQIGPAMTFAYLAATHAINTHEPTGTQFTA